MTVIRCPKCGLTRDECEFEKLDDTDLIGCAYADNGRQCKMGCADCALNPTFSDECKAFLKEWNCEMIQADGEFVKRKEVSP